MSVQIKNKCFDNKMASNLILTVLLVAALTYAASTPGRIVGGDITTIEKWPFIVQIESSSTGLSWSQYCAGNILNNRFVLSAAQCFDGLLFSVSRRRLRGGSTSRGNGGVVVFISRVFSHPNYTTSSRQADLALVQQAAAWVWSHRIAAVTIVPQDFQLPDNLPIVLAGWGATRQGSIIGQSSSTLREATVLSVNNAWCAERYASVSSRAVTDTMLCTASEDSGRSSCSGDEGGPVYFRDANDQVTLVGVISWRHACGNASIPTVNTKVSAYTNWIVINVINAS